MERVEVVQPIEFDCGRVADIDAVVPDSENAEIGKGALLTQGGGCGELAAEDGVGSTDFVACDQQRATLGGCASTAEGDVCRKQSVHRQNSVVERTGYNVPQRVAAGIAQQDVRSERDVVGEGKRCVRGADEVVVRHGVDRGGGVDDANACDIDLDVGRSVEVGVVVSNAQWCLVEAAVQAPLEQDVSNVWLGGESVVLEVRDGDDVQGRC